MWNQSLAIRIEGGPLYLLNTAPEAMTDAAEPYRICYPKSPSVVWAGDPGVPKQITDEDGNKIANPDWSPDSPVFETVFLAFPDEDTAKVALPGLWSEDV